MAAKKAPARKQPSTSKKGGNTGSSKSAEQRIDSKNRKDTKGRSGMGATKPAGGRTSAKSGLTGFGMTKSGAEARAVDAGNKQYASNFSDRSGFTNRYSGFLEVSQGSKKIDKNKSYKQMGREALDAANRIRSRYGMKAKKK